MVSIFFWKSSSAFEAILASVENVGDIRAFPEGYGERIDAMELD